MHAGVQSWFPSTTRRDARLRLICLPYAGGGAATFRPWAGLMPPDIEVVPVRLPGREDWQTQSRYRRLTGLVEPLCDAFAPIASRPYAVFGHSMGALIGFELVRACRRRAMRLPVHLFVSACSAPHAPAERGVPFDLPEPDFISGLLRLNNAIEMVVKEPALLEMLLPTIRADFELCQTYVYHPEPPLPCPITAFGGRGDDRVPLDGLLAWKVQTSAAFAVRRFDGDHFFLNSARRLVLGALLNRLGAVGVAHA